MLDPHHPLHRSIVRIRDKTGEIVGAGFLAAPTLVCTCAHVVCKALGLPPETHSPPTAVVSLDFPYLSEAPITALVEEWVPIQNKDGGGDIAVLRLTSKPSPDARPARLLPVSIFPEGSLQPSVSPTRSILDRMPMEFSMTVWSTAGLSSKVQLPMATGFNKATAEHQSGTHAGVV